MTTLTLSQDGSFTGAFSDSEMGERDENEYPNGTVYVCNFSGQFKDIKKVNDYTYSMTLDSVKVAEDEEKIEDGIRYKAGEPSGMDQWNGDLFLHSGCTCLRIAGSIPFLVAGKC